MTLKDSNPHSKFFYFLFLAYLLSVELKMTISLSGASTLILIMIEIILPIWLPCVVFLLPTVAGWLRTFWFRCTTNNPFLLLVFYLRFNYGSLEVEIKLGALVEFTIDPWSQTETNWCDDGSIREDPEFIVECILSVEMMCLTMSIMEDASLRACKYLLKVTFEYKNIFLVKPY